MTDQELIEAVAKLWVDGGGDAQGIDWCLWEIKQAVEVEIERRAQDENTG